jgi:predicted nucleic acid-binding protein
VVAAAVQGGADAIVTRDDGLLSLSSHSTVGILKASEVLAELRQRQ